jgi:zinc metalloprotease ZmpA
MNRFTPWRLRAIAAGVLIACSASWAQSLDAAAAAETARALLRPGQAAAQLAHASPLDEFFPQRDNAPVVTRDGDTHLRFERKHQGVRVAGGEIIVRLSPDGTLNGVISTLTRPVNLPSVVPAVREADALRLAIERFRQEGQDRESAAELVIETQKHFAPKPTLTWLVKVRGTRCNQPSWMHYVVDAFSGELLGKFEGMRSGLPIECAKDAVTQEAGAQAAPTRSRARAFSSLSAASGTGKAYYYGTLTIDTDKISDTEYRLRDTTRGSHYVSDFAAGIATPMSDADNAWGDGTMADRATVAVDAAYGQSKTWDYYKTVHSRNGLANDGAGYSSSVHVEQVVGTPMDNAYWDGTRMNYGDGNTLAKPLVSLDWAGHEMTHGVTQKTANLNYFGEAGGLNESTSDIFGTMIEYFANHPNDPPDYMWGEMTVKKAGLTAFRFMYHPSLDVGIFGSTSQDCWSLGTAGLDPHFSSGVGNHFYYLLAEGSAPASGPDSPVCKKTDSTNATDTVKFKGIGRAKSEKFWYDLLSTKLAAASTYADARKGMLELATADSDEYRHIDYAWLAVNVSDVTKVTSYVNNRTWQTAQIVTPAPELVIMGRRGVASKSHWFALYLDAGKSAEANMTAADASSNYDLVGYDSTGTKVLVSSKNGGGAKETITIKNEGTARKLFYVSVPYKSGSSPFSLRLKML